MPRGKPFQPGQSGNPKGRPKKGRALTDLLEKALDRKTAGPEGKAVARKTLMAERVAEAVATGYLTLTNEDGAETRIPLASSEWRQFVQWAFTHIDGAKVLNEHTGEGGGPLPPIRVEIVNQPAPPDGGDG